VSASDSWHQVSADRAELCCDGSEKWTSTLPQSSLDTWLPSAASVGTARPPPDSINHHQHNSSNSTTPYPEKNGPPKENAVKCTVYDTIQYTYTA